MSLCDNSKQLLKSYGAVFQTNNSTGNGSTGTVNQVFEHWCSYSPVSTSSHHIIGSFLSLICTLSITGNLLVIVVFSRLRHNRSPGNILILNMAISDMLNGFVHPMAVYSAFKERWMFEKIGCELYAALTGLFGLVSIVTLTSIAFERYLVISIKPWYGGARFTQREAKRACCFLWIYCFVIIIPPFFGWGSFVPEGFLTSCSFDYITNTYLNISYVFYNFTAGFVFPITIIIICYIFIMKTICKNEKDMKQMSVSNCRASSRRRNDFKAAEMSMFVIIMFLVSWTPYSVISMIGLFGDKGLLTPWVSVLPSLFAKMSSIYNPAIYGLSHPHFKSTLKRILRRERKESFDLGVTLSRNSILTRSRTSCPCMPNHTAKDCCTFKDATLYEGNAIESALEGDKVIYIKNIQPMNESCQCEIGYETEKNMNADELDSEICWIRQIAVRSNGMRVLMSKDYDDEKLSLIKSLIFKSERSIHEKYRTHLKHGHIVRIPTSIGAYGNDASELKNTKVTFHKSQLLNCFSTQCIRVENADVGNSKELKTFKNWTAEDAFKVSMSAQEFSSL